MTQLSFDQFLTIVVNRIQDLTFEENRRVAAAHAQVATRENALVCAAAITSDRAAWNDKIKSNVAATPAAAIAELRGLLPKRFNNLNLPALSMLAHFLALYPRCPALYSDAFKGMQAYWGPLCAAIVPEAKLWERAALTDAVQHVWAIRAQPYVDAVQKECARCGFTGSPLTEIEIRNLYDCGLTEAEAYMVACDVNAGFSLEDAKAGVLQNRPGPVADVVECGSNVDVRA